MGRFPSGDNSRRPNLQDWVRVYMHMRRTWCDYGKATIHYTWAVSANTAHLLPETWASCANLSESWRKRLTLPFKSVEGSIPAASYRHNLVTRSCHLWSSRAQKMSYKKKKSHYFKDIYNFLLGHVPSSPRVTTGLKLLNTCDSENRSLFEEGVFDYQLTMFTKIK